MTNKNVKSVAIIQARLGSKRFPNKVLETVNGKSLIEILYTRLKKSKLLDDIIFAIPKDDSNERLKIEIQSLDAKFFAGSEHDVLKRFFETAEYINAENIIRITADCPLIDHQMLDDMLEIFLTGEYEYLSNTNPPTYPDGFDIEIFSFNMLDSANRMAKKSSDREHVTPFIRSKLAASIYNYVNKKDHSDYRVTIDEKKDLTFIKSLAEIRTDLIDLSFEKIMKLIIENPNVVKINSDIKRNEGLSMGEGQKLYKRAKKIIPGGNMLLSKRPENFLPDLWPSYFSKAKGCSVWDLDGKEYLDMSIMGIGTNILGYSHSKVDESVKDVINKGISSSFNCPEEVYLAERMLEINPWADMVRFTRTGGELNAIAVRVARAATGRDKIAICGYHGWHDWYLSANLNKKDALNQLLLPGLEPKGVPQALEGTTLPFFYNDIESLERLFNENKGQIAAVKMEVSRNIPPSEGFLKKIRELTKKNNTILIFDECTSGFRETFGGLYQKYDVEPDIALYSKALGNGYAICSMVGISSVMEAVQSTFISSTFWSERIGPSAALATLDEMQAIESWSYITKMGQYIQSKWMELSDIHQVKISISGIPALSTFSFEYERSNLYKTYLTQYMLEKGILAANSIYVSAEHTEENIEVYLSELSEVFKVISKCENQEVDIESLLKTREAFEGFKRLN
ncbi:aminotransferase class III-fold pyridoxal phosphate-dependent enzyme [Gammaproteobacteria bacterium]|nr:aminotransferase class III-fold pyridoxal phosphate-dependent enzyme [Gammaproteobacteria bacterium]